MSSSAAGLRLRRRMAAPPAFAITSAHRFMTPIKFILRYTAIPFTAIVAVVIWTVIPSSKEIDARQYAALSRAYASFPLPFRREISETMDHGRINDRRYQALVRDSLGNGVALDWPASGVGELADERQKLAELIQADSDLQGHHQ
ncbi:hypothetical protein Bcep18194_C7066 [Burkholderia lata]|uniref:Uncharacterized protein n=2 Tax=Burkholderia lata (strain ATCC 17760 / DSM 23089 / LMG 22485 / NCIMB 9086 / R18194 / 383) TaxID=482957 RepID=Q39N55_BURL3|nr:hypothetical protein Bcep18194_C7066 [Burkholderia lata]